VFSFRRNRRSASIGIRVQHGPERASGSTILPDASGHGVNKTVRIDKPGMAAAYKDNKVRVYFTGRINYNDVFGRPHWTTFCAYHTYGQDLKLFNVCPTGNEMDLEDY
jgi:hypothetical protein